MFSCKSLRTCRLRFSKMIMLHISSIVLEFLKRSVLIFSAQRIPQGTLHPDPPGRGTRQRQQLMLYVEVILRSTVSTEHAEQLGHHASCTAWGWRKKDLMPPCPPVWVTIGNAMILSFMQSGLFAIPHWPASKSVLEYWLLQASCEPKSSDSRLMDLTWAGYIGHCWFTSELIRILRGWPLSAK